MSFSLSIVAVIVNVRHLQAGVRKKSLGLARQETGAPAVQAKKLSNIFLV